MTKTLAIFGDSIIGGAADGAGGLGRALIKAAPAWGLQIVDTAGVGGSTVANWMHASGLPVPGKGAVLGRWGDQSRMPPLDEAARKRAQIPRIAAMVADLYWINFGTNDFNSGRPAKMWADQAIALIEQLPERAKIVWTVGNIDPRIQAARSEGLALLQSSADGRWPGRVLTLDTEGELAVYAPGSIHPSVAQHQRVLASAQAAVAEHIGGPRRRTAIGRGLWWLLGGLGLALGLGHADELAAHLDAWLARRER